MCDPVSLGMLALSTASAGAAHQQASGAAKVQSALHKINQENSIRAMGEEQYDLGRRESQEHEAMAQDVMEINRKALIKSASTMAMMADSGVTGISMANIMRDVHTQSGAATSARKTNMQWTSENMAAQRVGTRNTAIQRMGQTSKGTGPSMLATGLKIGEGALGAYNQYQTTQ